MTNVVLKEEGRDGPNKELIQSAAVMSTAAGKDVGLPQYRVHTQPVPAADLGFYPVGSKINGHINRILSSDAHMANQVGTAPRLLDGKPTYIRTYLDMQIKDDIDQRKPIEMYTKAEFDACRVRNTIVEELGGAEDQPTLGDNTIEEAPRVVRKGRGRRKKAHA
jgi:hypothetical protein